GNTATKRRNSGRSERHLKRSRVLSGSEAGTESHKPHAWEAPQVRLGRATRTLWIALRSPFFSAWRETPERLPVEVTHEPADCPDVRPSASEGDPDRADRGSRDRVGTHIAGEPLCLQNVRHGLGFVYECRI